MSIFISTVTSWDTTMGKDIENYEETFIEYHIAEECAVEMISVRYDEATIETASKGYVNNLMVFEVHAIIEDEVVAIFFVREQEIF